MRRRRRKFSIGKWLEDKAEDRLIEESQDEDGKKYVQEGMRKFDDGVRRGGLLAYVILIPPVLYLTYWLGIVLGIAVAIWFFKDLFNSHDL